MTNLEIQVERHYFAGMFIAVIHLKGILSVDPRERTYRSELEQTIEELLAENVYRFIFDLSGFETIGSTFLGFFIKVAGQAKEKGGSVVLFQPSEKLKTALEVVGLGEYISLPSNLESAFRFFPRGTPRGTVAPHAPWRPR